MQNQKVEIYYGSTQSYEKEKRVGRIDENALYFIDGILYCGYDLYTNKYEIVDALPTIGVKNIVYVVKSDKTVAIWDSVDNMWIFIYEPNSGGGGGGISETHTHDNKSVLDKITQTLLDAWNSAVSHISDTIKHITNSERTNWNNAYNKAHEHSNKTVLDNTTASYTAEEKSKLSNLESGAKANVQADWNITDSASDAYIKNKPSVYTKNEVDNKFSALETNIDQNAFSKVVVGSTTVSADSKTDTLTLVEGSNVTISADSDTDKITISSTDTKYTHPTYTAKTSGLYKMTVDATGHVSATSPVTKEDITALGVTSVNTDDFALKSKYGDTTIDVGRKSGTTVGNHSTAVGYETTASGVNGSHAEGHSAVASGASSHAEGFGTIASGAYSHAEGYTTTASGNYSHTEGYNNIASGHYSHAEGHNTIASGNYQHVQGKFNVEDTEDKYAFIVGNGTSDINRSNAFTVDWDGNVEANNFKGLVANTTTTESGYGLDATVAKSLQDQITANTTNINTLNSNKSNRTEGVSGITFILTGLGSPCIVIIATADSNTNALYSVANWSCASLHTQLIGGKDIATFSLSGDVVTVSTAEPNPHITVIGN